MYAQNTIIKSSATNTTVNNNTDYTIIKIASPDSNGLSVNEYIAFDTGNNGTGNIIFVNRSDEGLSQITGGNISGNANITAGSEANLILNQVTAACCNSSDLEGMIEVLGTNAAVIIANPFGITCNGCGFINASRIDLVNGTRQSDGSFNIGGTISVLGSGLDASGSELNIVSNLQTISAPIQAGTNLRILSGNSSYDPNSLTVTSNGGTDGVYAVNIDADGSLQAGSIEVMVTRHGFINCGTIEVENDFNATVIGTVVGDIQQNHFVNGFHADDDCKGATIQANNFNLTAELFLNANDSSIDVASDFNATIVRDNGDIASGFFTNNLSVINTNNFNITANYFYNWNSATFNTDAFVAVVDGFNNDASSTIIARICSIDYINTSNNEGTFLCFEPLIINIARPDANGLSNNSYTEFSVAGNGIVLNNSDSAGRSQLAGMISANSNYLTGDIATLILNQITGSDISVLNRTIEVFGAEAGVIIANPNGIECDGCGFINTSKVDLVTGTANFSGDDLTGFSIDDAARFFVRNTGFVNDAVADELNLVSRDLRIQAQVKANNTLRVLAGNETYDHTTNIITSDDTEVSAHSIQINASGYLEANYIELISTEISSSHGILSAGGDIEAGSLKLDSNGLFRNQNGGDVVGDINISGLLEVITADRLINNGNITADTLTITVDEFYNNYNGSSQLGKIVVTDTFSLSTPSANYRNTGTVESDSLNLATSGDFTHESTTLNNFTFNNLAITTASDYTQSGAIDVIGDLYIQVSGEASLDDIAIQSSNLFFSANDLYNQADINISGNATFDIGNDFKNGFIFNGVSYNGGDISTDGFSVTATGNFQNNYNAMIDANNFNVIAGDEFINNNSTIIANNSFNVTAGTDFFNQVTVSGSIALITTNNFNVVAGDNFFNQLTESAGSTLIIIPGDFNVTVGGNFENDTATINADNVNVTAENSFTNKAVSIIAATNLDFAADIITNAGNINASTILTITATNTIADSSFINTGEVAADRFNLSVAVDFDYINDFLNNGNITARSLNLNVDGNFSNNDENNNFIWGANNSLVVSGNADITTNNYTQSGVIDVTGALNISAGGDFTNSIGGDISAGSLGLTAGNFIQNDGTIITDDLNIGTGSNFANQGDITANTSLTITATNDVVSGGNIITDDLNIEAGSNFANQGDITAYTSLTVNAGNLIQNDGAIDTDDLNIGAGSNFTNQGDITAYTSLTVNAGNLIQNDGAIDTGVLTIDTDTIHNPGNITANTSLTITAVNNVFSGGSIITNALDIDANRNFANHGDITADSLEITAGNTVINDGTIVSGSLDVITADFFRNLTDGNISVNSLNITAGGKVTNIATITAGTLNIIANNDSSRTEDTTGFYVANRGDIQATNLNIAAEDNFYNRGNITANTFNITKTIALVIMLPPEKTLFTAVIVREVLAVIFPGL